MLWLLSAIWSVLSILYFSCFLYRDRFGKVSSIILLKIFLHVWLGIRLLLHLLFIAFVVWYYPRFPECFLPGFSLLLLYVLVFCLFWELTFPLLDEPFLIPCLQDLIFSLPLDLNLWWDFILNFLFEYLSLSISSFTLIWLILPPSPRRDSIPLLNSIILPWIVIISFNSVFMVFTHAFIHILFELLEQVYNCYFEVLYIS